MYLLYVDESGDPGTSVNSPVRYFILSGFVVHELRWASILSELVNFRRHLSATKGLKLREEIHAVQFVNRPADLKRIKRNDRIDILKQCVDWLNGQQDLGIITVAVDKRNHTGDDIFELAWSALLTRFENTIRHRNFPGPSNPDDKGLILPDNTDGQKLQKLTRKLRRYNPVPNRGDLYTGGSRNIPIQSLVEDPVIRDSNYSYFIQMADVVAYCARQLYEPNKYMKKKGGGNFYRRLNNVIVHQVAPRHPLGIVEV